MNKSLSLANDWNTLEKTWFGKFVDYIELRVFGCHAYAHMSDGKLESRARKCIFLDYACGVKEYMLWCTEDN